MSGKDRLGCVLAIVLYMFSCGVAGFWNTTILWVIIGVASWVIEGFMGK